MAIAVSVCALGATEFSARLDTRITSFKTKAGTEFRATVLDPAIEHGKLLIPEGAELMGRISSARSVGVGLVRERAELTLDIYAYRLPDGTVVPCSAQVVSVDNARETTTPDGRIRGVLAASGPAGLPRGLWRMPNQAMLQRPMMRLTGYGPGGFVPLVSLGLLAVRWTALRFPEPEIVLPTGTELVLALTSRAWNAPTVDAEPIPVACSRMYRGLPRDVRRPNGELTDDLVNVILSGTREQVQKSFEAAGWVTADPLTKFTFMRMYKAWTSMRGYPTAPVSRLEYEGRSPDLVFQKSFNTVARRHHIRLWQVPGRDVWLGAATHDVSIGFEFSGQVMTHRIDRAIDGERAKVFSDLRNSGCLAEAGLLRVGVPAAKGRLTETDGHILRLGLRDCIRESAAPAEVLTAGAHSKPGNAVLRMTRRFTLETKQYVYRDNYFYWGFRAVRAGARRVALARTRSDITSAQARRADAGSDREALTAGTRRASIPATIRTSGAPDRVIGSIGFTE